MYCNHYGFSEKPFDVTPDPRFLYLTEGHRETLAAIIYGIRERRGFITIVGEVGTGKTTLLKTALDRLDEKTRVAFIFNTDVTFDQMLIMALYEWGLVEPKEKLSKVNAIHRLNNFAIEQKARGGNVALIVDEAQNLDNRVMENLRLLSNLETRRHKLVQIVLSGQPELDTKLNQHELRQFAQRISLRRYVFPFDEKDTYAYLHQRLQVVNHKNSSPFTDNVQKLIWEYSGGVPRKINNLCDNALLIGYGLKKKKINSAIVKEAAQDLKWPRLSDTKASFRETGIKILLRYKNEELLKTFNIDKDEIAIGRLSSNDIHINNTAVSRQHARIIRNQGNYLIEDLKSTNGIYLNKVRIISRYLKDGDVINIGKHTLVVNIKTEINKSPTPSLIKTENDKKPAHSIEGQVRMLNIERLR
jgi:general secretion pathway protein A